MKKQSHSIHHEKGFILPSVLFLTTIVLLYFSSSLLTYKHDVQLTFNLIEQVKSQTLFQMAYMQYKTDYLSQNIIEEDVDYSFPTGEVKVKVIELGNNIQLEFIIQTNNNFNFFVTKSSNSFTNVKAPI
ncbi:hypothetical protein [Paucisalibacillus globulus]|jgi:hypothetical protein|uniref:hypothetical protein n=1 Tax=Paucisalibacillus globulus TaxID=351095 RepID=UPI000BB84930|nr:hypothetical protein [Paucisalibacillus globulus]